MIHEQFQYDDPETVLFNEQLEQEINNARHWEEEPETMSVIEAFWKTISQPKNINDADTN